MNHYTSGKPIHSNESIHDSKSAQNILMNIDPNFSRAVGLLNKYMTVNDYNQNRASGPESEINSLSQANTLGSSLSKEPSRLGESGLRGGSTMSDLHNTEYMDDSKSKGSLPNQPAESNKNLKITEDTDHIRIAQHSPPNKAKTAQKINSESASGGPTAGSSGYSYDATETGESDSETSEESAPFTTPDPTAERDLDNASPKTIALCEQYPCHYCFFVYFSPATVDEDLMPFRRKTFVEKVARLQNPEHIREVKETKCARDAYADRRIQSIERQSGTQIRLSELDPETAFVKGLPRRRLTIAGPSFANIGCALNLFESLLPNVIRAGIFPFRLPEGSSTRYAAGSRPSSTHQWYQGRKNGTVYLRQQLDDKGGWRSFLVPAKSINAE